MNNEFGFTLDVCATAENAKCERYFSPEIDGLAQDWDNEICWMNPPYGREISKWMEKAAHEAKKGTTIVCLVPARTDTKWWHNFVMQGEIRFIKGRLKFSNKGSAPFPSAVVIYNQEQIMEDFAEIPVTGNKHREAVYNFTVGQLLEAHSAKDDKQGNAWAKRGFSGFWYFFANHWDRLEVLFTKYLDSGREKKHIIDIDLFDALVDVAMHALKLATVLSQLDPDLIPRWRQRWQQVEGLVEGSMTFAGKIPPTPEEEEGQEAVTDDEDTWGTPTNKDGMLDINL